MGWNPLGSRLMTINGMIHLLPIVLGNISRRKWLSRNMTDNFMTGTLNQKTSEQMIQIHAHYVLSLNEIVSLSSYKFKWGARKPLNPIPLDPFHLCVFFF